MGVPKTAMVLAAGQGKRMRPYRRDAEAAGQGRRPRADRPLPRRARGGRRGDRGRQRPLPRRSRGSAPRSAAAAPRVVISDERDALLDTGGGISKRCRCSATSRSCCATRIRSGSRACGPTFTGCAGGWDDERMDGLLLLASTVRSIGYSGRGDFFLDKEGPADPPAGADSGAFRLCRRRHPHPAPFRQCARGRVLAESALRPAIAARRLFGVGMDGAWINVGDSGGGRRGRRGDRGKRCVREMRGPNVFTIPPGAPFLDTLVAALLDGRLIDGFSPQATRSRSPTSPSICRPAAPPAPSARAFSTSSAAPLLLPTIRTLGDIDEDDLACRRLDARRAAARRRPHGAAARADQAGARLVGRTGAASGGTPRRGAGRSGLARRRGAPRRLARPPHRPGRRTTRGMAGLRDAASRRSRALLGHHAGIPEDRHGAPGLSISTKEG